MLSVDQLLSQQYEISLHLVLRPLGGISTPVALPQSLFLPVPCILVRYSEIFSESQSLMLYMF